MRHLISEGAPVRGITSVVRTAESDRIGPCLSNQVESQQLDELVVLSVGSTAAESTLRQLVQAASGPVCLRISPGRGALEVAAMAHKNVGVVHFLSDLAGTTAPPPSDLLRALGVSGADVDTAKLMLAEHVPSAG